jgi:hypothetical protein
MSDLAAFILSIVVVVSITAVIHIIEFVIYKERAKSFHYWCVACLVERLFKGKS